MVLLRRSNPVSLNIRTYAGAHQSGCGSPALASKQHTRIAGRIRCCGGIEQAMVTVRSTVIEVYTIGADRSVWCACCGEIHLRYLQPAQATWPCRWRAMFNLFTRRDLANISSFTRIASLLSRFQRVQHSRLPAVQVCWACVAR